MDGPISTKSGNQVFYVQKVQDRMITPEYCQLMVRYNAWQNNSILIAADRLDDEERWQDRGAFFGSIAATLNHIYWGDVLWSERLSGNERPQDKLSVSMEEPSDWETYKDLRNKQDVMLEHWASTLDQAALEGQVVWYSADGSQRFERPRPICIAGLFNHQTHHRGQVHCMLTAAGTFPEPTDLIVLD